MDMSQGDSLSSSSTNEVRGHKRPRYPKKHLVTCNDTCSTAASIPCECDKYEQDQRSRNGKYYTIWKFPSWVPLPQKQWFALM